MTEPFVWRARSTADLLQAVPALLGFHPQDALVLVVVDRGRVQVTARVDLASVTTYAALRSGLHGLLNRFREPWVLAAAFSADADLAWQVLDLVDLVLPDVWGLDLVHVHDDRWFAGRDDWGRPYDPGSSVFTAEAVFRGRSVLSGREALACSLDVADAEAATKALAAVLERDVDDVLDRARVRVRRPEVALLPAEAAAELAVAAFSDEFAAEVLSGLDPAVAPQQRRLWTQVVRQVPEYAGAAACLVLGVVGWLEGDGALVNVCLDRARPFADETPWFALLEAVVTEAIGPDRWPEVRAGLSGVAAA